MTYNNNRSSLGLPPDLPPYVAVEGPIGVGKTTLVERLAEKIHARTYFEVFEENPFLSDFYKDQERYAFQTEVFFLLSRYRQQENFGQGHLFRKTILADYIFAKSRLFASLTLSDHELAMYDKVYDLLKEQITPPDLIIYLDAPVEILLERVKKRGRAFEENMDQDYLARLSRLYHQFFRHYDGCPVLSVNTTDIDYTTDDDALDALLSSVSELWIAHNFTSRKARR